jgi:hypothetical protein
LAAPFGDEPCFEAGDIAGGVGLDLVDPHVVNDHAVRGKVNEFPCAVVYEGGILLLQSGLPLGGHGLVQRNPVRFGSTHSRAERRATAIGDVPASAWGGPMMRSGT